MYKDRVCVIVANGLMPKKSWLLELLRKDHYIVAADGALDKLASLGLRADVLVGDLDSVKQVSSADRLIEVKEQESNDLQKAFNYALTLNPGDIYILGANGLREDHALTNMLLLPVFARQFTWEQNISRVCMLSDFGEFYCAKDSFKMSAFKGQAISLFNLDEKGQYKSFGLKYEINGELPHLLGAALNEASDKSFGMEGKGEMLVYKAARMS